MILRPRIVLPRRQRGYINPAVLGALCARRRSGTTGGGGGGGGDTDPNFANVSSLLHFDEAFGSPAVQFADNAPGSPSRIWTQSNNAQLDTTLSKFGAGCLKLPQRGDRLTAAGGTEFDFGTGDFTIEAWVWFTNYAYDQWIFGHFTVGSKFLLYCQSGTGTLRWAPTFEQTAGAIGTGAWVHIAAARASGTLKLFIGGTQGASFSNATNITGTTAMEIGNSQSATGSPFWVDDLRVTKGVARYTANFTVPSAAFPDS